MSSSLSFDPSLVNIDEKSFSGAFLAEKSYMELLSLADTYFELNMRTASRVLPCCNNSYLLISRDQDKIFKGIGKKVSLQITGLLCDIGMGYLVAIVQMKNNFTSNRVPHIVLAKKHTLSNYSIGTAVAGSRGVLERLYIPVKIHGKIGIMSGSDEETAESSVVINNGLQIHQTNTIVHRPEVTMTVEHPLPQKRVFMPTPPVLDRRTSPVDVPPTVGPPTYQTQEEPQQRLKPVIQQRPQAPSNICQPAEIDSEGSMKIEIKKRPRKKEPDPVPTGDIYKGEPVMRGPRGGLYIMKGKNRYAVKPEQLQQSDVVYKVNMLSAS